MDVQVTSLALCKRNKNEVFLRGLNKRARHDNSADLFWRFDEVPEEALQVLQVRPLTLPLTMAGGTVFSTTQNLKGNLISPDLGPP